jgi:hypothetical protein
MMLAGRTFLMSLAACPAWACASSSNSAEHLGTSLSCERSLDDYCAQANSRCVRGISIAGVRETFCYRLSAPIAGRGTFSIEACNGGEVGVIVIGEMTGGGSATIYLYTTQTDSPLYAVVEVSGIGLSARPVTKCLAGPTTIEYDNSCLPAANNDITSYKCDPLDAASGDSPPDAPSD